MSKLASVVVAVSIVLSTVTSASGGVAVQTALNADALVDEIIGPGVSVVPGSVSYTGAFVASGFFTRGISAGIGMESGIIMTSGNAGLAQGSNTSDSTTGINDKPGDADLDAMLPDGVVTYDAAVLEFDFVTAGGDLSLNYVFASDEYNEYVNTIHSDVFAFFLNGENIALIPGTDIPVSVNTVNGGGPAFGDNPSYPEFYNNNDLNDGGPFFDFEYDGFTTVFTAEALGLAAGTHHIKLAIADTADKYGDSAVFIETGTFSVQSPLTPTPIPAPGALVLSALGLAMVRHLRRRRTV